jgi:hypothetical protein
MNFKKIIFVLMVLLLSTLEIFAGGKKKSGTAGAEELLIPIGARGTALGGSYIASISGVDATYWNPAGVSNSSLGAEAYFSNMSYFAGINVNAIALSGNFEGFGSLALSIRSVSFGDIPVTDELHPDGSWETFSPSYTTVGLTYSKSITDRVRVGLTANIVTEQIMRVGATGVSFDIGIQYAGLAGVNGLKIGLVVKNLGPQMKYDGGNLYRPSLVQGSNRGTQNLLVESAGFELPSYFEIGIGYDAFVRSDHRITLGSSFENNNFSDDEYKVSMEYAYKDLFFARGSYQMAPTATTEDYLFGPAFGAGIHYNTGGLDLTLDYAYRWNRYFDASNIVSLKVGF